MEISPTLSEIQAKNLCDSYEDIKPIVNSNVKNAIGPYRQGITKDGIKIFWYYSVNDVPQNFSVIIAHEFFDALPIHKFQVIVSLNSRRKLFLPFFEKKNFSILQNPFF